MSYEGKRAEPVGILGRAIRERRKAYDLSLAEAGAKVDLSASHLGRIERAEQAPRLDTFARLCNWLAFTDEQVAQVVRQWWHGGPNA